jgi:hypothetical protein
MAGRMILDLNKEKEAEGSDAPSLLGPGDL